jgi:hypothetical protein
MLMPKASMHEYNCAVTRQHKVWFSWQAINMQAIAKAGFV